MGDRVAVLRTGKLQQFASPSELYDRPANAFVAGFDRITGDEPDERSQSSADGVVDRRQLDLGTRA